MELLITILGWVGSFEVIAAYALNSYQKVKSDSVAFQLLNLTGAIFLIINSIYKNRIRIYSFLQTILFTTPA